MSNAVFAAAKSIQLSSISVPKDAIHTAVSFQFLNLIKLDIKLRANIGGAGARGRNWAIMCVCRSMTVQWKKW